jgi:hypothetical protein
MLDLAYVTGTIAFFAIMLLYVRFCLHLSGANAAEDSRNDA